MTKVPPILKKRSHNYHWPIRSYLVEQQEEGKKGCKQTNPQTIIDILLTNSLLIRLFTCFLRTTKLFCVILPKPQALNHQPPPPLWSVLQFHSDRSLYSIHYKNINNSQSMCHPKGQIPIEDPLTLLCKLCSPSYDIK